MEKRRRRGGIDEDVVGCGGGALLTMTTATQRASSSSKSPGETRRRSSKKRRNKKNAVRSVQGDILQKGKDEGDREECLGASNNIIEQNGKALRQGGSGENKRTTKNAKMSSTFSPFTALTLAINNATTKKLQSRSNALVFRSLFCFSCLCAW